MPNHSNTPADRIRSRTVVALAHGSVKLQAHQMLAILGDAVADCDDTVPGEASPGTLGSMTLAEARSAYEACDDEMAVSIALEGLEVIYGESFLPGAVARPAPALSATTLTLCQRALETRLADVEAEVAQAQHHQHFFGPFGGETMPVNDAIETLDAEADLIREALRELADVSAATPGTPAC